MIEIINSMNSIINTKYEGYLLKNFGFCELMDKTSTSSKDQPIPVTIPDRLQVSLDDRFEIITWIRWIDKVSYEASEDWSFGTKDARLGKLPLRLVFAHKVELGEDVVFDFVNSFPEFLPALGYQFVFVNGSPEIDPDHETIYKTELGQTVYERHRFPWNLYTIDFNMEFILCATDDIRVTESGDYRIIE